MLENSTLCLWESIESAIIIMSPSNGFSGNLFLSKPYTLEGPDYKKKYQHYIDTLGVVIPTQHRNSDILCDF